jgi:hypothetical protein
MVMIQKLFQKYRGEAPPVATPVRPVRSLPQILLEDSQGGIFLISNLPTRTRNHAARGVWNASRRKREVTQNTDAMFRFVQHPVSTFNTHYKGNNRTKV